MGVYTLYRENPAVFLALGAVNGSVMFGLALFTLWRGGWRARLWSAASICFLIATAVFAAGVLSAAD
ncbi:hypothetical protein DB32_003724 [Sandaracinus amylolyticus]|uniref:Uncharacterized protein n=1 Tax=Sandaracinus amylolyticus TaxID=927083 RepID=A0A0F6W3J2_9BACT|nr:hypothetical protein DB32_003724 [Sandaracinus amylolyticus]